MSDILLEKQIKTFLDENGRLKQLPAKQKTRDLALRYLAERFDADKTYSEPEVNELLLKWHTFNDYFILRRSLVDGGFLKRRADGSQYWKEREEP